MTAGCGSLDAAAVRTAMAEYVRYVRRVRLKELSGRVMMDDNWTELEQAETKEDDRDSGLRAD